MKSNLMKNTLGVLTLSALGLMATGAHANWERGSHGHAQKQAHQQSWAYSQQIDIRQDRQIERIQAGLRKGYLTHGEFRDLMHDQQKIRAMERYFRADGFLDTREFQRLERALDRASLDIRVEKHDRQAHLADGRPRFD